MKRVLSFVPFVLPMLAVLLCALPSCVAQGPEVCVDPRGNTRLVVSVSASIEVSRASSRVDLGGYEIDRAHVWVFDPEGRYVASAEGSTGEEDGYEFWLTIPAGRFDFVVWTNTGEEYSVTPALDSLTMSEMELWLDHGGETLTRTIPHLLHGISHGHTIVEGIDNRIEMEITPKTYAVNLTAINLPEGDDDYAFTITDNNSHYTFEGDIIEDMPLFTHYRMGTAPRGEFHASIRTLTLSADRHPRFTFTNTTSGATMHDADLIQTITRAYSAASRTVDFSSTYVYDIVLSFDATKMEFTVSVNGWEHDERYEILK